MGKEICHYYGANPEDVEIWVDGIWLVINYNGEERIQYDSIDSYSILCKHDFTTKLENHDCVLQIVCTYLRSPEEHNFHFQPEQYAGVFDLYHALSQILQSPEHHDISESS